MKKTNFEKVMGKSIEKKIVEIEAGKFTDIITEVVAKKTKEFVDRIDLSVFPMLITFGAEVCCDVTDKLFGEGWLKKDKENEKKEENSEKPKTKKTIVKVVGVAKEKELEELKAFLKEETDLEEEDINVIIGEMEKKLSGEKNE